MIKTKQIIYQSSNIGDITPICKIIIKNEHTNYYRSQSSFRMNILRNGLNYLKEFNYIMMSTNESNLNLVCCEPDLKDGENIGYIVNGNEVTLYSKAISKSEVITATIESPFIEKVILLPNIVDNDVVFTKATITTLENTYMYGNVLQVQGVNSFDIPLKQYGPYSKHIITISTISTSDSSVRTVLLGGVSNGSLKGFKTITGETQTLYDISLIDGKLVVTPKENINRVVSYQVTTEH